MATSDSWDEKVRQAIEAEPALRVLFQPARMPRYRYYGYRQHRFCWTTERMDDGTFRAFEYRPVGKGSRSGKAREWRLTREVSFKTRATAKRRARKWYETAKSKEA